MLRTLFSFIIDEDPVFDYMGWHLARSLIQHCGHNPSAVCVQCTPRVDKCRRNRFQDLGVHVYDLQPFGNTPHCNKLNQLENVDQLTFDHLVLLDTDMIVVKDFREHLHPTAIQAKIVDWPRPPIETLEEVAATLGRSVTTDICSVDGIDVPTYRGNCNGGFYSIPRRYCQLLSRLWREDSTSLLRHLRPLEEIGHEMHVDQVSFWLALQRGGLSFELAPSNFNYFVHFNGEHRYFDERLPICVLHYHRVSVTVAGLLEPPAQLSAREQAAVDQANQQIASGFHSGIFWQMRYTSFPGRGSGLGSRGDMICYKRDLLRLHGVENASLVLDVGCGDLEVMRDLSVTNYTGMDICPASLAIARAKRPEWNFILADDDQRIEPADLVVCFEVLIHQADAADYNRLLQLLCTKAERVLLVSGFESPPVAIKQNPILFFHEPLRQGLVASGRFRAIREIARHTSVVVYRCDV